MAVKTDPPEVESFILYRLFEIIFANISVTFVCYVFWGT